MYSWDSRGGTALGAHLWGCCGATRHGRRGGRVRHREWSAPSRWTPCFAAGTRYLSWGDYRGNPHEQRGADARRVRRRSQKLSSISWRKRGAAHRGASKSAARLPPAHSRPTLHLRQRLSMRVKMTCMHSCGSRARGFEQPLAADVPGADVAPTAAGRVHPPDRGPEDRPALVELQVRASCVNARRLATHCATRSCYPAL